jgi:hypothetical protein
MKAQLLTGVRRRDLFRLVMAGAVVAVTGVGAAASEIATAYKRRARYQPNSAEVQNFYRVNRYPQQ